MAKLYTGTRLIFNTGGTKTKLAISNDGESLDEVRVFETNPDFELWAEELAGQVKQICGETLFGAVAGGIAGVFDEKKTKLIRSPNLPEWENRPIKKKLEEKFAAPVILQNDVAMEGLGEATMGAGRHHRIVAFVAVGTGIGGVKITDGKICPNASGFEPGHQIVDTEGEVGYLEDFAGGAAMRRAYGKDPEEIEDEAAWEIQTRMLAIGLHNAIVFWSPEILILGGGLMKRISLEKIEELLKKQMQRFPKLPKIAAGELEEKAGLYGALQYLKITH